MNLYFRAWRGKAGRGRRGVRGKRETQEAPEAAHHLHVPPTATAQFLFPENAVPLPPRARRARHRAGALANSGSIRPHI